MPVTNDFQLLDPTLVQVARSDRQRTKLEVEDLKDSISRFGVWHPIIVTRDLILIAGERRLQACKELGLQVPIRFFDTLTSAERHIVELQENLKRSDLDWQDQVRAVQRIHKLYVELDPTWTITKTAEQLGFANTSISQMLRVAEELPKLEKAPSWRGAYNELAKVDARKADVAMSDVLEGASQAFASLASPVGETTELPPPMTDSIIVGDFRTWSHSYKGPKFNLLHCDFPFGIDVFAGPQGRMSQQGLYHDPASLYEELLEALLGNLENFFSHSGHLLFWFSMQKYEFTVRRLSEQFTVNPYPLVWLKSDHIGVAPDPRRGPRQIYETALLAWRGDRPIVKIVSNAYAAPTDKSIHPSAKPEPMLKYFFEMLVDGTTRMLDPTAGGGSALRAAEHHGAEYVFGIDSDATHVRNANDATRKARLLRSFAK